MWQLMDVKVIIASGQPPPAPPSTHTHTRTHTHTQTHTHNTVRKMPYASFRVPFTYKIQNLLQSVHRFRLHNRRRTNNLLEFEVNVT
jgi:hypothetical protein